MSFIYTSMSILVGFPLLAALSVLAIIVVLIQLRRGKPGN